MVASATLWMLWIVLQCSVVALLTLGTLLILQRVRPETRGRVAFAGLACMAFLVLAGLIPGEGWIRSTTPLSHSQSSTSRSGQAEPEPQPLPIDRPSATEAAVEDTPLAAAPGMSQWQRWTGWFVPSPQELPAEEAFAADVAEAAVTPSPSWLLVVALALLIAELVAVARITAGFCAIRRLVARSEPCDDAALRSRLAELCQTTHIPADVALRISHEVRSPAVVGWRRYTVLLPPEYRQWSAEECDAVLAHELAHVTRHDGWWRTAATLLHALHFYNPLAYLLARRYCLEQELAADQLACEWLGEREGYLQSLGNLALRRTPSAPAWTSLAFLPSRSMFVRRLEMLRHAPPQVPLALERAIQGGSLFALIVAALVLGGLRPLKAQPPQNPPAPTNAVRGLSDEAWLGNYVPIDRAHMLLEINVAQLLKSPQIAALLTQKEQENDPQSISISDLVQQQLTLMPPDQVKSVLAVNVERRGEGAQGLVFVQSTRPVTMLADAQRVEALNLVMGELYQFQSRFILVLGPHLWIHSSDQERLEQLAIYLTQRPRHRPSLNTALDPTEAPLRFSVDWQALRPVVMAEESLANSPIAQMISPLIHAAQRGTIDVRPGENGSSTTVQMQVEFPTEESAKAGQETLVSLRTLLKNLLQNVEKQGEPTPETKAVIQLAGELLESSKAESSGTDVVVTASTESSLEHIVAQMLPALQASRMAAQRMQDMNHARQIGLAFHNYYDTYGHLPKSIVVDPESGEKRSWRVELLPFLGYQPLYDQYRKDQPWDSEANRRLLLQMPPVYGSATTGPRPTSAFFVVTGPRTALAPSQRPPGEPIPPQPGVERPRDIGDHPTFFDFTDGTSSTVLFLQTQKNIPWTKPEDIPLDEATAAKLGGFHPGGFLAGLADGSVKFVANTVDAEVWKNLLIRDDGQGLPPD